MAAETLGERVRRERLVLDLSQRELSVVAGVGYPYISKIEGGKEIPSDQLLARIATALRVDPEELLIVAGRIPRRYVDALREDPARGLKVLRSLRGE